ncbi:hypothetical protein [Actinoplanes sp. NPDC089786]
MRRQYTGTAGRIENSQVEVFLGYAASGGNTLIDRRCHYRGRLNLGLQL